MQNRKVILGFTLLLALTGGLALMFGLQSGSNAAQAAAPASAVGASAPVKTAMAPAAPADPLEASFHKTVQPFVQTYCVTCHGGDKPKADFNLSTFASVADVTKDAAHWSLVLERLKAGEMPPDTAKLHPTADQVKLVADWITAFNTAEAKRHAGDPGPVLARRLSNAEYDYTIRDLTGVDIRPTKEFPVDPANQAGFDNTGESLSMSPTLFKKYYAAAQDVADHMVFEPDGFTFAPYPMLDESDRDKYSVLKIVDFYRRQPTDFADYFRAAWLYQHRAELGQPQATLADIAAQAKVSVKYLTTVWGVLSDPGEQVGPLAKLQSLWKDLPAPANTDAPTIRARVAAMRDFVVNLRTEIIPAVGNLSGGMPNGSQPMVLWMDRQMAANRRTYDPNMLIVGTPPAAGEVAANAAAIAAARTSANFDKDPDAAPTPAAAKPASPTAAPATTLAALAAPVAAADTAASLLATAGKAPVAIVNPTPAMNARLPSGLGLPVAPVAKTAADGRPLSALEISQLAEAAQPARPPNGGGGLPKTPDIVKFGGVFLEPAVTMTSTSATVQMAAVKRRTGNNPDLYIPDDPAQQAKYMAAFARFADVFPDAFYISERARVFYDPTVEEALEGRLLGAGLHAQTGYFRDDGPLYDLILDDAGKRELDNLWETFYFDAEVAPRMLLGFLYSERGFLKDQEFDQYRPENKAVTTQPMIKSLTDLSLAKVQSGRYSEQGLQAAKDYFAWVAASNLKLDQMREAAVPGQLKALQDFAERAYRRPLTQKERDDLVAFYHESRDQNGGEHEDAMRDTVVRILMSPYFMYRLDLKDEDETTGQMIPPAPKAATIPVAMKVGAAQTAAPIPAVTATTNSSAFPAGTQPLSDYALASRLSYFLWSSMPDQELMDHAKAGDLHKPEVLVAQAHRLMQDSRIADLATEFAGNWLDVRRFEEHNAVDRDHFPSFTNDLREAMFQEPIHFFVNLIQKDRPVLDLVYGDYTFVNPVLAAHYGMTVPAGTAADQWVEIDDAQKYQRGGLLPMSVFLTKNAPGLRTSPVKRGYWVVSRLLGEHIPPPPPNVPAIPTDESKLGNLTLAETMARHHADPNCASCHEKFDAFGLVFEGYGPIGEIRTVDLGNRPVETTATFPDGSKETGLDGLRTYLRTKVQGEFVDNLCRKLLAYGLGRTLLPSDDLLVDDMRTKLAAQDYHFDTLVDEIVLSPQFLTKRVAPPTSAVEPQKTAMNN